MVPPSPGRAARPATKKTKQTFFKQPTLPGAAVVAAAGGDAGAIGGDGGGDEPADIRIPALSSKMEDNWVRQQFAADGKKCLLPRHRGTGK